MVLKTITILAAALGGATAFTLEQQKTFAKQASTAGQKTLVMEAWSYPPHRSKEECEKLGPYTTDRMLLFGDEWGLATTKVGPSDSDYRCPGEKTANVNCRCWTGDGSMNYTPGHCNANGYCD